MDSDSYLEQVIAFCQTAGYLLNKDAAPYVVDYCGRSISPSMAGTLLIMQSLALDYTASDVVRLVRASERAIECAKLLELAKSSGQLSESELRDAKSMLAAFIEPSSKGDRFAHSFLANFGSFPVCENTRKPSSMEIQAAVALKAAFDNHAQPNRSPGMFGRFFGKIR